MKMLTLLEARKLVWLTWFELVIAGVIVYIFTNPVSMFVLLAAPFLLHALVNFWVKSDQIPVKFYSVVPTLFLPTAFLSALAALVAALVSDNGILNSLSLGLATVCLACVIVVYPESKYADYG